MSLHASVIDHQDVTNASGELITKYLVEVKYHNASYTISKRYSEFKTLYEILKDLIPLDYKFPNKSMFHNNAQATKERRIRGFDQLMQILLSRKPVPTVMERFLGINERKAKSLQIRSKSLTLNKHNTSNGNNPTSPTPTITTDEYNNTRHSNETESSERKNSQISETLTIIPERRQSIKDIYYSPEKYEMIRYIRLETPYIITSSMKITSMIYIILVIIHIIDISDSDFYEILVTICVLSFMITFIRINILKYSYINNNKTTTNIQILENSIT